MRDGKNGRLESSTNELSQFDDKKPEELDSEFDHFDAANSYPTSPFKGRNIMDLDFMYKQLLDRHKPCNITFILDTISKRKIDKSYKHFIPQFAELQYYCQTSIYDVNVKCAAYTYSKFLLSLLTSQDNSLQINSVLSELDIY